MGCIEVMINEHKNIKRVLVVMRRYCYAILQNKNLDYQDFFKIIYFARTYADKHHHAKEEAMLFDLMESELGVAAIKMGMEIEHDLGRNYIRDLEDDVNKVLSGNDEARLDIIANAISYANLLKKHIEKEDDVIYKYAERGLKTSSLEKIDKECERFDQQAEKENVQQRCLEILSELEANSLNYS